MFNIIIIFLNYFILFGFFISPILLALNSKKSIGLIIPISLLILQSYGIYNFYIDFDKRHADSSRMETIIVFGMFGLPIIFYACIIIWNIIRVNRRYDK